MYTVLKRVFIGKPLSSADEQHQRLRKLIALPVFASDAISSTAYATEEILLVLLVQAHVGASAFDALVPIAIMVAVLLFIVASSYRQTIFAYPSGGGSYVVSRENLGETPSLVAGASLLVDYVLTVAVSVAGGVAAIVSAFDGLEPHRVELCLLFVALMTVANLRGLKESGALFAPPTYVYVGLLLLLIGTGLFRIFVTDDVPVIGALSGEGERLLGEEAVGSLSLFWVLKAFSSGAVALTGVEAVSNGVPAFRRPESRNAARTLVAMAVILGGCFLGLSVVASHLKPVVEGSGQTVLSALAEQVYGGRNVLYFATQFATFAILILAANTAYADFPRISSIIARDGYWPRQFSNRGDRLVFSNGIVLLALMASGLIVAFGGLVSALIPLYAVGVFTGFTLSQTGMVRHHFTLREPRWQAHAVVNGIGALTTAVVAGVVVVTKFTDGAWIPAALIPAMLLVLKGIHRHYERVRRSVHVATDYRPPRHTHYVVVLVANVNRGVVNAISYARSLAPDRLVAVSVVSEPSEEEALHEQWTEHDLPVELVTLYSPYRELTRPVLRYLDELDRESGDDIITVVIPEFVTTWSTQFLHNQSALALKARLLYRPNTVVTSVPVVVDPPR